MVNHGAVVAPVGEGVTIPVKKGEFIAAVVKQVERLFLTPGHGMGILKAAADT